MENVQQYLSEIEEACDFSIQPLPTQLDFNDRTRFAKLDIDKSHLSMFTQQILPAAATGMLANAYSVKFPEGMPHTLMKLKDGGVGSAIMGEKGIIGQAPFHRMIAPAVIMGVFTVMSAVTGQYFLAEINSKLDKISQNVSDILAFLYGDKKAELVSEISFIQYAQRCYDSIAAHESQRIATISGIQDAKKVAMKDIEFYLNDLEATVKKNLEKNDRRGKSLAEMKEINQIMDSLELSLQLYIISCILEPYYAQNFDKAYLDYLIENTAEYVSKYREKIRTCLGMMHGHGYALLADKPQRFDLKSRLSEVERMLEKLPIGEAAVRQQMHDALYAPLQSTELFITENGEAYYAIP